MRPGFGSRRRTADPAAGRRSPAATDPRLAGARLLARLLDDAIPIPGTSYRIGLDPLLGLVPGVGDVLGSLLSTWILLVAARLGAPASVLARIGAYVALDALVGLVPLAGDLFDFGWKANARSLRLLETWLARPEPTRRASGLVVAGILVAVLAVVAAILFAGYHVVAWAARTLAA